MKSTASTHLSYLWLDVLFLLCIIGGLYFFLLGARPLFVPDEGRYAEIAREMVAFQDYLTPHLNGIKYFEKPILFYWLSSFALKLFGTHIASVRSVNVILGLFGCLVTYFAARTFYDRRTGLYAGTILGTSLLYFIMANMVTLDLSVTVWSSAALFAFLAGMKSKSNRLAFFLLASISASFAVLTKGLIGLLFPFCIISVWLTIFKKWQEITLHQWLGSFLLCLAICLPWHLWVNLKNPEFFHFYFIEQHLLRYLSPEIGHEGPKWFFIPCVFLGLFPWSFFLIPALLKPFKESGKNFQNDIFLLITVIFIFLFFSFSKSKLIPYILPIFPASSILIARYLTHIKSKSIFYFSFTLLFLFSILLYVLFYEITKNTLLPSPALARFYLTTAALSLTFLIGISLYFIKRSEQAALFFLIVGTLLFLTFLKCSLPFLDSRSIKPLAQTLKPLIHANDLIVSYNQYYQDLPFYLERHVAVLNWKNELAFGLKHQPNVNWMIDENTFWHAWGGKKRVFAIISMTEYQALLSKYPQKKFYIYGKTTTNLLISNQKFSPPIDMLSH